ncbi:MAG: VWA domain-containing protein [Sulfolobaceae archaeon]
MISLRLDYSHRFSTDNEVKGFFRIMIIPEKLWTAKNLHHIILIDTSSSMKGEKIEKAKVAAERYLQKIPEGNIITLIAFSTTVDVIVEGSRNKDVVRSYLNNLIASGVTALYTAISTAIKIAKSSSTTGIIVLLTDGMPTDVTLIDAYRNLQFPQGYKWILLGLGQDYNEELLKLIADQSGGVLFHIEDPEVLPNIFDQIAIDRIAAKNLKIHIIGENFKILNYTSNPIFLGAVESIIKIYGEYIIPPRYSGDLIKIKAEFLSEDDKKISLEERINILYNSNKNEFLSNINKEIIYEYNYLQSIVKYYEDIRSGDFIEATRRIKEALEFAERTRRIDLIEATRRMLESHEQTIRLQNPESTRKFQKEITSEVTKKLRSSS